MDSEESVDYIGVIDLLDIVHFLMKEKYYFEDLLVELGKADMENVSSKEVAGLSFRNPYTPLEQSATIREAMLLLGKETHHLPVVKEGAGVVSFVTASTMLQYLKPHKEQFAAKLDVHIRDVFGTQKPVYSLVVAALMAGCERRGARGVPADGGAQCASCRHPR